MFYNSNIAMKKLACKLVNKFAKDKTGKIQYEFDQYGFRKLNNYNKNPQYTFFGCSTLFGVGVQDNQIFTQQFENFWTFGLAGKYTEDEIIENYKQFQKLGIKSKVIFLWRDNTYKNYLKDLDTDILHCVPERNNKQNCIRLMNTIDYDVSKTHWGPKTHQKFYKLLSQKLL